MLQSLPSLLLFVMDSDNYMRSAAALLNSLSTLVFWLHHLPLVLPRPHPDNEVYGQFYAVLQHVYLLLLQFPSALPATNGLVLLHVRGDATPEATGSQPTPQPPPRPPREPGQPEAAPEVPRRPAPMPCPTTTATSMMSAPISFRRPELD